MHGVRVRPLPFLDTRGGAIALVPAYLDNGANWLDYVLRDGSGVTDASDAPCTGSELGYTACIHGGEVREVIVPSATSCTGIEASDALAAFTWTCEERDGNAALFSGLADGKGLSDLVTASGWLPNHVTVTGAGTAQSTPDAVWWTNPIVPLPDNSAGSVMVLEGYEPGTIFNGANNVLSQLVVSHSTGDDLMLSMTSNNRFPGYLLHDGACSVTGGTAPGLLTVTCAKENAADTPATVAGIDASTMLVGGVTSDSANQSANNGGNVSGVTMYGYP